VENRTPDAFAGGGIELFDRAAIAGAEDDGPKIFRRFQRLMVGFGMNFVGGNAGFEKHAGQTARLVDALPWIEAFV